MFATRITKLRQAKGWTQAKLADESKLSQSTINTLEKRTKHPDAFVLNKVAKALGVTSEDLLDDEEVIK